VKAQLREERLRAQANEVRRRLRDYTVNDYRAQPAHPRSAVRG
jgi:hypothetical protein